MPHLLQACTRICSLRKQIKLMFFLFFFLIQLISKGVIPQHPCYSRCSDGDSWLNVPVKGFIHKKLGAKVTQSTAHLAFRKTVTGGSFDPLHLPIEDFRQKDIEVCCKMLWSFGACPQSRACLDCDTGSRFSRHSTAALLQAWYGYWILSLHQHRYDFWHSVIIQTVAQSTQGTGNGQLSICSYFIFVVDIPDGGEIAGYSATCRWTQHPGWSERVQAWWASASPPLCLNDEPS